MFKDFPDRVFAVRRESPLIVGVAEGECFIASDVPAILQYTRDYYLLDHDEIVTLSPVGEILEHNSECKRTLKLSHYAVNCFKRISVVFIVEELSNNLCICVA